MALAAPWRGGRQALAFLTPLGGAATPGPEALAWFPVVGALLGLALGAVWLAGSRLWPAPVAAALVVTADLAGTGLLHLDGLADSADGLLPPLAPARRLEVMTDPATGAFGVGTVVTVLLLRTVALASMAPSPLLLAGLWCGSRAAMAATTAVVPYIRPGGLATPFLEGGPRASAVVGILGALLLAGLARGPQGVAAVGAGLIAAALVVGLARRRLGGFTGDVLGAAGMASETVGLLVAAARL